MKKALLLLGIMLIVAKPSFSQFEDRFSYLTESEIGRYAQPLATSLGTAFNSGTFHTADVPQLFGFTFSIKGMYISIPDDQRTFTPELPAGYDATETATIYGNEGGYYAGPDGYKVYPPGLDATFVPAAFPQIAASFMGTELMIRGLPSITVGETSVGFFGAALKHNISQYIPGLPVDLAAQFLYSTFTVKDVVDVSNIGFNAQASKSFGLFTAYGALQYETTSMDLTYTFTDPENTIPGNQDTEISASIDGENNFRFTLGGSLKFGFFRWNADFSITAQPVFTTGLNFEF